MTMYMQNQKTNSMDLKVLRLLEDFEKELETAKQVPMTGKVMIDREVLVSLVNDINILLPEEYQHVKWIESQNMQLQEETRIESERIMKNAYEKEAQILEVARQKEEALMNSARQKVEELLDEHRITDMAKQRADSVMQEANDYSKQIKEGSYEYLKDVLMKVSVNVHEVLETLQSNVEEIESLQRKNDDVR